MWTTTWNSIVKKFARMIDNDVILAFLAWGGSKMDSSWLNDVRGSRLNIQRPPLNQVHVEGYDIPSLRSNGRNPNAYAPSTWTCWRCPGKNSSFTGILYIQRSIPNGGQSYFTAACVTNMSWAESLGEGWGLFVLCCFVLVAPVPSGLPLSLEV